MKGFD